MNLYKLPPFEPVTKAELRRLWAANTNPDLRRLILEVERCRRVMQEVERYRQVFEKSWKAQGGGHLVGLHLLKVMMMEERDRTQE